MTTRASSFVTRDPSTPHIEQAPSASPVGAGVGAGVGFVVVTTAHPHVVTV